MDPTAKKRMRWARLATPAAVTLALGLLAMPAGRRVLGVGDPKTSSVAEPLPVAVEVEPFLPEVVSDELPFSGTLKERQKLELSFKVPGTVRSLYQVKGPDGIDRDIQAGDRVPMGAAIAKLDDLDYLRDLETAREQLARAKARVEIGRANADLAKKDLVRYQNLASRGSVADQSVDTSHARARVTVAELIVSEHEVASAELALRKAEQDLKDCTLTVPLADATVVERMIEQDERLAANKVIFRLIDVSKLVVTFGVPDAMVGLLRPGQTLSATSDAFRGESFAGRVTKIAPMADSQTRTFPVEVTIDEPRGLRPGMVVTVDLGHSSRAYLIPVTAALRGEKPDDFAAYEVVEEGGQAVARRRAVELDGVGDNRIKIKTGPGTGLREGAMVVVSGANRLHDGQIVRILGGENLWAPVASKIGLGADPGRAAR
jgi:RND family efflux transporter MFP subunit